MPQLKTLIIFIDEKIEFSVQRGVSSAYSDLTLRGGGGLRQLGGGGRGGGLGGGGGRVQVQHDVVDGGHAGVLAAAVLGILLLAVAYMTFYFKVSNFQAGSLSTFCLTNLLTLTRTG